MNIISQLICAQCLRRICRKHSYAFDRLSRLFQDIAVRAEDIISNAAYLAAHSEHLATYSEHLAASAEDLAACAEDLAGKVEHLVFYQIKKYIQPAIIGAPLAWPDDLFYHKNPFYPVTDHQSRFKNKR